MTKDEWKRAIEDQTRSGKTVEVFCQERGLNRKTFAVNKSVLKRGEFVEVKGEQRRIEIVLESGITIRVSVEDVAAVVGALRA